MGGSGSSSRSQRSSHEVNQLRDEVRRRLEAQELLAAKNTFLAEQLAAFNDRDVRSAQDRLEQIEDAIAELSHEIDRLLFGGSVAKHTYVDGLSDVDALVFLNSGEDQSPTEVLESFADALRARLDTSEVQSVSVGHMAVTVLYADGAQIQLLPATERGTHTVIPSEDGASWKQVRPHKFAEKLSETNAANAMGVVPAIKLAKALLSTLPKEHQLAGYHVEALAVDAFRKYEGARDRASMLQHLMNHASTAVLRPTGDITGQSIHIDSHLGPANSAARSQMSAALGRLSAQLSTATDVDTYREVFGG